MPKKQVQHQQQTAANEIENTRRSFTGFDDEFNNSFGSQLLSQQSPERSRSFAFPAASAQQYQPNRSHNFMDSQAETTMPMNSNPIFVSDQKQQRIPKKQPTSSSSLSSNQFFDPIDPRQQQRGDPFRSNMDPFSQSQQNSMGFQPASSQRGSMFFFESNKQGSGSQVIEDPSFQDNTFGGVDTSRLSQMFSPTASAQLKRDSNSSMNILNTSDRVFPSNSRLTSQNYNYAAGKQNIESSNSLSSPPENRNSSARSSKSKPALIQSSNQNKRSSDSFKQPSSTKIQPQSTRIQEDTNKKKLPIQQVPLSDEDFLQLEKSMKIISNDDIEQALKKLRTFTVSKDTKSLSNPSMIQARCIDEEEVVQNIRGIAKELNKMTIIKKQLNEEKSNRIEVKEIQLAKKKKQKTQQIGNVFHKLYQDATDKQENQRQEQIEYSKAIKQLSNKQRTNPESLQILRYSNSNYIPIQDRAANIMEQKRQRLEYARLQKNIELKTNQLYPTNIDQESFDFDSSQYNKYSQDQFEQQPIATSRLSNRNSSPNNQISPLSKSPVANKMLQPFAPKYKKQPTNNNSIEQEQQEPKATSRLSNRNSSPNQQISPVANKMLQPFAPKYKKQPTNNNSIEQEQQEPIATSRLSNHNSSPNQQISPLSKSPVAYKILQPFTPKYKKQPTNNSSPKRKHTKSPPRHILTNNNTASNSKKPSIHFHNCNKINLSYDDNDKNNNNSLSKIRNLTSNTSNTSLNSKNNNRRNFKDLNMNNLNQNKNNFRNQFEIPYKPEKIKSNKNSQMSQKRLQDFFDRNERRQEEMQSQLRQIKDKNDKSAQFGFTFQPEINQKSKELVSNQWIPIDLRLEQIQEASEQKRRICFLQESTHTPFSPLINKHSQTIMLNKNRSALQLSPSPSHLSSPFQPPTTTTSIQSNNARNEKQQHQKSRSSLSPKQQRMQQHNQQDIKQQKPLNTNINELTPVPEFSHVNPKENNPINSFQQPMSTRRPPPKDQLSITILEEKLPSNHSLNTNRKSNTMNKSSSSIMLQNPYKKYTQNISPSPSQTQLKTMHLLNVPSDKDFHQTSNQNNRSNNMIQNRKQLNPNSNAPGDHLAKSRSARSISGNQVQNPSNSNENNPQQLSLNHFDPPLNIVPKTYENQFIYNILGYNE